MAIPHLEEAFVSWKSKPRLKMGETPDGGAPAWLYQTTFAPDERFFPFNTFNDQRNLVIPSHYTVLETLLVPDPALALDPVMSWRGGLAIEMYLPDPAWVVQRAKLEHNMQDRIQVVDAPGLRDHPLVMAGIHNDPLLGILLLPDQESTAYIELIKTRFGAGRYITLYARPIDSDQDETSAWFYAGKLTWKQGLRVGLDETEGLMEWLLEAMARGALPGVATYNLPLPTPGEPIDTPSDPRILRPDHLASDSLRGWRVAGFGSGNNRGPPVQAPMAVERDTIRGSREYIMNSDPPQYKVDEYRRLQEYEMEIDWMRKKEDTRRDKPEDAP